MKYYIESIGFISANQQFQVGETVYPRGTLLSFFPDAVPQPEAPEGKKVIEGADGWEIVDLSAEEVQARVDAAVSRAWAICDAAALEGADHNSRMRYVAWLIDDASSSERKSLIVEVQDWMDSVWQAYGVCKEQIESGNFEASPVLPGVCPHTFWDIAEV